MGPGRARIERLVERWGSPRPVRVTVTDQNRLRRATRRRVGGRDPGMIASSSYCLVVSWRFRTRDVSLSAVAGRRGELTWMARG